MKVANTTEIFKLDNICLSVDKAFALLKKSIFFHLSFLHLWKTYISIFPLLGNWEPNMFWFVAYILVIFSIFYIYTWIINSHQNLQHTIGFVWWQVVNTFTSCHSTLLLWQPFLHKRLFQCKITRQRWQNLCS